MKLFTKVFVAGTFDRFHVGHQWLLWQGSQMGKEMVVVIARDETVGRIKGRTPIHNESDRLARVHAEHIPNATVRLGRSDQDFWQTLAEENPDCLLLGYDQRFDEKACRERFPDLTLKRADAYFPAFFKSSKFLS